MKKTQNGKKLTGLSPKQSMYGIFIYIYHKLQVNIPCMDGMGAAPENWCLEDEIPFGARPIFRTFSVSLREGSCEPTNPSNEMEQCNKKVPEHPYFIEGWGYLQQQGWHFQAFLHLEKI